MDCEQDHQAFYKAIKDSCKFKHPGNKLPKMPWFLKSCQDEKVESTLAQLLYDSKYQTNDFIDKAAQMLMIHRAEKESQDIRLASLLKENIEIREHLKFLNETTNRTKGEVNFVNCKSDIENITISFQLGDEYRNLSVGESFKGDIILKNDVEISVYTQSNGDSVKLDEISLFFGSAFEDIYYLSLVEKPFFSATVEKGDERYKVELEITVFLSDADKKEILIQHLVENETLYKREQEDSDVYAGLLSQLGVVANSNKIYSTYAKNKERSCCAECYLI